MIVNVLVNGRVFDRWTSVTCTRSLETTASNFDLSMSSQEFIDFPANDGDEIKLRYGQHTIATGKIDKIGVSYSANDHTITINARSFTRNLIDCSIVDAANFTANQNPVDIVKQLVKPFGINVISKNLKSKPFSGKFEIKAEGETVFDAIHRLAELAQFTVTDTENGDLLLTSINRATTTDSKNELLKLAWDDRTNILTGSFSRDITNCFSDIFVRGQGATVAKAGSRASTSSEATATDTNVKEYRPLVISAQSESNQADMQATAAYEMQKRSGQRNTYQYSVQGWAGQNSVWRPNTRVSLQDDFLYEGADNEPLLITEVQYAMSDSGTICNLTLNSFDAWAYEPIKDSSSKEHKVRDKKRKTLRLRAQKDTNRKPAASDSITIDEYEQLSR